ncbi:MAG TPA: helix-turn-helix transcriptional regulator [Candidatus Binatia bacterium]|nr:helix-turn-helix transcriptional regulator [Candidatus Binatia bacterium]
MTREERAFLKGLGQQVRILRQSKNLTQAELAEKAEVGMKYVGEVERGRTNPTLRLVWRLSEALGVEVFELFLFSVIDREQDRRLRTQIVRLVKDRRGKDLERTMQILKVLGE